MKFEEQDKLIITAALVGAEVTRKDNPNLPITPEEIGIAARDAVSAGASIIHFHMRDEEGKSSQSKELFQEAVSEIKRQCSPIPIIQITTGGAVGMSFEERAEPLQLNPEMATLTTGTVNFGKDVFYNPLDMVIKFAEEMKNRKIKPEVEVFDAGMINTAKYLVKKGLLEEPLHFDFVMGVPGGIPGTPEDLVHLKNSIPSGSSWTVAGIGSAELPLGVLAITMGGHVRVGFEDNVYYHKGVLAHSNAQLVARIKRLASEMGREVASPDEARKILKLNRE